MQSWNLGQRLNNTVVFTVLPRNGLAVKVTLKARRLIVAQVEKLGRAYLVHTYDLYDMYRLSVLKVHVSRLLAKRTHYLLLLLKRGLYLKHDTFTAENKRMTQHRLTALDVRSWPNLFYLWGYKR